MPLSRARWTLMSVLSVARLRKENADLRMDREILRKAAAYFAKETTR